MKRKNNKNKQSKIVKQKEPKAPIISNETKKLIAAIALVTVSFLLILAGAGLAGNVGNIIYSGLSFLFGFVYWFVPVVLIGVGLGLFKNLKTNFGVIRYIAAAFLFFFVLGLVEVIFPNSAGIIGNALASPLVYAFDKIASSLILIAGAIVSLIIMLDKSLFDIVNKLPFVRKPELQSEKEIKIKDPISESESSQTSPKTTQTKQQDSAPAAASVLSKLTGSAKKELDIKTGKDKQEEISDDAFSIKGDLFRNTKYSPPPIGLLKTDSGAGTANKRQIKEYANKIQRTLANFNIPVEIDSVSIGPTVIKFALTPAEGIRLDRIKRLKNELQLALAVESLRIEAPIPGKSLVGIELPNTKRATLGLGSMLKHPDFVNSSAPLLIALGKNAEGRPFYADISKMPHMLVAGTTGSGKSVTMHNFIVSLIYRNSPEMLQFMMIDPKQVEFTLYNGIPHLITPVITDAKKAVLALKWLVQEMERRYEILNKYSVRDISSYHKNVYFKHKNKSKGVSEEQDPNAPPAMPYIVLFLDEMSDLMSQYKSDIEAVVVRLAQKSRAVGIHLVLATQYPVVSVVTGIIKANIPTRVALQVTNNTASRVVLDEGGAEQLLGKGDLLYLSADSNKPVRLQAPFVSEEEIRKVVDYLKKEYEDRLTDSVDLEEVEKQNTIFSETIFNAQDEVDDPLYPEAREIVIQTGKASTSWLQRKLKIGYARAARLMDILEENGIVGPAQGSKPREVLVKPGNDLQGDTQEPQTDSPEGQNTQNAML